MNLPGITIVGLGPGDPSLMTRQAWQLLQEIEEIYLRTRMHPTVAGFPAGLRVHSFDHYYEEGASFDEVYENIIETILTLSHRESGVVYGVPGHPFVAEMTCPEITRRAKEAGIPVTVVEGLSFLEPTFSLLGIDPLPQTAVLDALQLTTSHHPPFPPNTPAVIAQIHSPLVASDVKLTLMANYADNHKVHLVHGAGTPNPLVEDLPLHDIDHSQNIGLLTTLYIPPLADNTSFEVFQEIIAHLRAPEGCPWDRDQTHQSLRSYLMEETFEVLAALDSGNQEALREELGDLLLQIVLHTQIAHEYGEFSMPDVLQGIHDKLIRRHPHVFSDLEVDDKNIVLENWEKIKSAEREENGLETKGILEGVSKALPALVQAKTYQERVNRVGFDWPNVKGVFEKIEEETLEIKNASSADEYEHEIGDLLFSAVNLARWYQVDAESALRSANARFRKRFEILEGEVRSQGRDLTELSLEELDILWNSSK